MGCGGFHAQEGAAFDEVLGRMPRLRSEEGVTRLALFGAGIGGCAGGGVRCAGGLGCTSKRPGVVDGEGGSRQTAGLVWRWVMLARKYRYGMGF